MDVVEGVLGLIWMVLLFRFLRLVRSRGGNVPGSTMSCTPSRNLTLDNRTPHPSLLLLLLAFVLELELVLLPVFVDPLWLWWLLELLDAPLPPFSALPLLPPPPPPPLPNKEGKAIPSTSTSSIYFDNIVCNVRLNSDMVTE